MSKIYFFLEICESKFFCERRGGIQDEKLNKKNLKEIKSNQAKSKIMKRKKYILKIHIKNFLVAHFCKRNNMC